MIGPLADALSGIRVLDLSRLLPGPFLTMVLADMGADVVKVEDPRIGDLRSSASERLPRLTARKRALIPPFAGGIARR